MAWVLLLAALALLCRGASVLDAVDPFIGSGGSGYGAGSLPPGAQLPFSAVRVSPDTAPDALYLPFDHFGGYQYADTHIRVFSHLHMQGSGVSDLGIVAAMPYAAIPTANTLRDYGFASRFTHARELASPGYYSVHLDTSGVDVELTASLWTATHRYSWPATAAARVILFPMTHGLPDKSVRAALVNTTDPSEISGFVTQHGGMSGRRASGVTAYFVVRFSEPVTQAHSWGNSTQNGWVAFGANTTTVEMYVGVSWISIDQARRNLAAAAPLSFNATLANAQAAWTKRLGAVTVEAAVPTTQFYTALYHSLCAPSTMSEAGGVYLGFDGRVHTLVPPMRAYYSDISMWDVYRTQMPLLSLLAPNVMADVAQSIVLMGQQGGSLPQWPFVNVYTCSMVGQHAVNILADAYLWGVGGVNYTAAYALMTAAAVATTGNCTRRDVSHYAALGYVPVESSSVAACLTIAYAHNDLAISALGAALGMPDAPEFAARSENYRNVWSAKERFYCPRHVDGSWLCPNKLDVFSPYYVEGDAWHYRFDGTDPLALFGSAKDFAKALSELMERGEYDTWHTLPDPYYWAGNEPDIGAPWQFAHANRSDLTAKYVRWVAEHAYGVDAAGVPGNDDYGALSAWLVWAHLGLYPLFSGTPWLSVSIPLLTRASIVRDNGALVELSVSGAGSVIGALLVNGTRVSSFNSTLPIDWLAQANVQIAWQVVQ